MSQFTVEQQLLGSVMYFLFLNDVIRLDVQCLAIMLHVPPVKDHLIKGTLHLFHTPGSVYSS